MGFDAMGFNTINTIVLEGRASSTFMADECRWKRWLVPLKHFYTPNKQTAFHNKEQQQCILSFADTTQFHIFPTRSSLAGYHQLTQIQH